MIATLEEYEKGEEDEEGVEEVETEEDMGGEIS